MSDERRAFLRLTLTEPLDGWFGDFAVRVVDVSASGAQLEHDDSIPTDARGLLRFFWRGNEVEILAETARLIRPQCMGVRFLEESELLRALLATSAAEVLRALEANARGDREANVVGDETLTSAWRTQITGYVCWIFENDTWQPHPSSGPEQPENGFTISAGESDEQVAVLQRTYEMGDAEARKMTRLLAQLSCTE